MTFGKRVYISPTQIKMLMDCPTKWWFAYVKRPPATKSGWLPFGGAYHKALETYFSIISGPNPPIEIMTGRDLPIEQIQKTFQMKFHEALGRQEYSFVGTPGKEEFLRRGNQFLELYLRKLGHLQPTMVEEKFNLRVKDGLFYIKGVIDLVTETAVIDHKTANKSWLGNKLPSGGWDSDVAIHWAKSNDRASQEIQSYAYPWAYWRLTGKIPNRFEFHVVHPRGLEIHRIRRTEKELEWFEKLATAYFKMAQGDVFPPRDNWWGCNSRWCDYWKYCKGKYQVQRTDF